PAARPVRQWHLRRKGRPVDHAMRLLSFADTVTRDEADIALGAGLLDELAAVGLVVQEGQGWASPFRLKTYDGIAFFADDLALGGEAVMGGGALTGVVLQAALAERRIGSALDLGCGAGLIALCLARRAARVVATDINPRALVLVRVNA